MRTSSSYIGTLPWALHDPRSARALKKLRECSRGINRQLRFFNEDYRIDVALRGRAGRDNTHPEVIKRRRKGAGPQMIPLDAATRIDVYLYLRRRWNEGGFSSKEVRVKVHPRVWEYMRDVIEKTRDQPSLPYYGAD
jgi:hypothetical protein